MELSLSEQRGAEAIQDQSDDQLLYTFDQFTKDTNEFDFVEYMVIPVGAAAFPVPKNFFIWAVYQELLFRELV